MNRRHYSSVQTAKHVIDKIDGERVIKIVDQEDSSSALEQGRKKKYVIDGILQTQSI